MTGCRSDRAPLTQRVARTVAETTRDPWDWFERYERDLLQLDARPYPSIPQPRRLSAWRRLIRWLMRR